MASEGHPFGHALGVIIGGLKDDPQTYAKPFYTLEAFKKTYVSAIMHPNSNVDYSGPMQDVPPAHEGMDDKLSDNEILDNDILEESSSDSDKEKHEESSSDSDKLLVES